MGNNKITGMLLAAAGSTLWGINGAFADVVFSKYDAPVEWVVATRLFMAGLLILLYAKVFLKQNVFSVFRNKKDTFVLLAFGLVGMIGCQYLFFLSIGKNGAGLATILQFTSPIFIYLFLIFRKEKAVHLKELVYIALTIVGVVLIVTSGNLSRINVNIAGLLIGIGSAIGVAFYTLQPRRILKKYGSPIVVGWGMLIGGGSFQFIRPTWNPGFPIDIKVILYMLFIIVVGTAVAFVSYLGSVNYIEASLSNVIAASEPLVANILTPILLGGALTSMQMLGIGVVLTFVILFANYGEKNKNKKELPA
jgi:drug/metabolite transporter (DMT)-like permease